MVHCDEPVAESDPQLPIEPLPASEPPPQEGAHFVALRGRIGQMLRSRAQEIAKRWAEQARSVALRESDTGLAPQSSDIAALITALGASLTPAGTTADDIVVLGVMFGEGAFDTSMSLHHMLKGLDLLSAMVTYAVEADLAREPVKELGLHDAIRLVRQLQQRSSLLLLAASKGYTQALGDAMRDHFRHLRHDLRNPLGTIKSALALMEDETIPVDQRSNPRLRAMARRNARSLAELIASRLSDHEVMDTVRPLQVVLLRTVAYAVRRSLREEIGARAVTVLVAGTKTRVRIDAAGLELLMHELLLAALAETAQGDEVSIEFSEIGNDHVAVHLRVVPPRALVTDAASLDRLTGLAKRLGAQMQVGQDTALLFPAQHVAIDMQAEIGASLPVEAPADVAASRSSGRNAGNDVRSSGQREHGQSSPF